MINLIIGLVGAFFILFAFIMNQIHKWKSTLLVYDLFNLIGSLLLIVYSYLISSYPFMIINLMWLIVSVRDVYLDIKKVNK